MAAVVVELPVICVVVPERPDSPCVLGVALTNVFQKGGGLTRRLISGVVAMELAVRFHVVTVGGSDAGVCGVGEMNALYSELLFDKYL